MTLHNYSENAQLHPSIMYNLLKLRDDRTGHRGFRKHLRDIGVLLGTEVARDLQKTGYKVRAQGQYEVTNYVIDNSKLVLLGILRAAAPLVDGLVYNLDCSMAFADIFRDEKTLEARERRMDSLDLDGRGIIVADPMLATGGTIVKSLEMVLRQGTPEFVKIVGVLGTQYAIDKICDYWGDIDFPVKELDFYLAAIDDYFEEGFMAPGLNSIGYIVPGLGDAGDRAFGTI